MAVDETPDGVRDRQPRAGRDSDQLLVSSRADPASGRERLIGHPSEGDVGEPVVGVLTADVAVHGQH